MLQWTKLNSHPHKETVWNSEEQTCIIMRSPEGIIRRRSSRREFRRGVRPFELNQAVFRVWGLNKPGVLPRRTDTGGTAWQLQKRPHIGSNVSPAHSNYFSNLVTKRIKSEMGECSFEMKSWLKNKNVGMGFKTVHGKTFKTMETLFNFWL